MKLQSLTRISLTLLVVTMCVSSVKGMEYDTDRGGLDYKNFDLTKADPALCQTSCSGEAQCKAWTYVKPGIQGAKARCWLKTSVPAAKPDACCVSGVKGMEYDTDRGGLDYKNFDLTKADPALCQISCSGEAQCKAWTYVKPGIQGAKARCWLKTSVPAAKPDACCVSGVKDPTPTPIQDFQVKCCGQSMSGAKVCINATLKNFTSSAVDYSTKYIGLKGGECVKYDDNHCKQHPGVICIPPCVQISPPTPVTIPGPSVSVPAQSSKTVDIVAPNHAYVMGSVLEVQSADGTLWRALVTPTDSCVN